MRLKAISCIPTSFKDIITRLAVGGAIEPPKEAGWSGDEKWGEAAGVGGTWPSGLMYGGGGTEILLSWDARNLVSSSLLRRSWPDNNKLVSYQIKVNSDILWSRLSFINGEVVAEDPGMLPEDPADPWAVNGWRGNAGIGGVNILSGCPIWWRCGECRWWGGKSRWLGLWKSGYVSGCPRAVFSGLTRILCESGDGFVWLVIIAALDGRWGEEDRFFVKEPDEWVEVLVVTTSDEVVDDEIAGADSIFWGIRPCKSRRGGGERMGRHDDPPAASDEDAAWSWCGSSWSCHEGKS